MKRSRMILFVLGLIIGLAVTLTIAVNSGLTKEAVASGIRSFDSKQTGSMGSGDAVVELKPTLKNNWLILKFSINTHSVRLNRYDLKDITTLEYKGNVLKPIKAGRIGGHHSSGTIVFDVAEDIGSFTIRIQGIPRVNERIYKWNAG